MHFGKATLSAASPLTQLFKLKITLMEAFNYKILTTVNIFLSSTVLFSVWFKELSTSCRSKFECRKNVTVRTFWALATKVNIDLSHQNPYLDLKSKFWIWKAPTFAIWKNVEVNDRYYCRIQGEFLTEYSLIKPHKRIMIPRDLKSQVKKKTAIPFCGIGKTQFNHSKEDFNTQN